MKRDQWICHDPVFECEQYNPEMLIYSPWAGHRNFAYDYLCYARPRTVVELGSYYGCSAFAFLQAIKDHALDTSFYAVDTWAGDDFTKTDYTEDIYNAYRQINEQCFSGVRSTMVRKTFDEACGDFADRSIDLLHIDGSHKYEDVKNDYLRWRGKVADDGVVFFHDVGDDLLFGEPMGSHIFWEELKSGYPFTAEFPFSNGLGILFCSEDAYRQFLETVPMAAYQQRVNLQDTINKDMIRKNAFTIRDLRVYNTDLQEQIRIKDQHLASYRVDTAAAAEYIRTLETRCADYEKALAEKDERISGLEQDCAAQKASAQELHACISGLEEQIGQLGIFASDKDRYAQELETQMEQLRTFASDKERYAQELETQMGQLRTFASDKDRYAQELETQMEQLRTFASDKERYAEDLETQMEQLRTFASDKERYAQELETQMEQLRTFASDKERYAEDLETQMEQLRTFASDKERYTEDLESQLEQLRTFASDKERYAQELENQMEQLRTFASGKERYTEELLVQITELNRYAEAKTEAVSRLEADLDSLGLFVRQKETYIAELEKQVSDLNIYADGKCAYIDELERARAASETEAAALSEQLAQKDTQLQVLADRYRAQRARVEAVCEKIRKLPFGRKLAEEMMASGEEEQKTYGTEI